MGNSTKDAHNSMWRAYRILHFQVKYLRDLVKNNENRFVNVLEIYLLRSS